MPKALTLYGTTVGKKVAMAVSGGVLLGFVIGHLLGNLQLYQGPRAINEYAVTLRELPALLWGTRALLSAAVGIHIAASVQLATRNVRARPGRDRRRRDVVTSYAARTMYWSGPILALYIAFHLAHLTFGYAPGYDFDPSNVYNNTVYGFRVWWISAIYIVGNLALGLHLYHGIWSAFQTVGVTRPEGADYRRWLATALAVLITAGNVSFPIAVMTGLVEPTSQTFHFPELE